MYRAIRRFLSVSDFSPAMTWSRRSLEPAERTAIRDGTRLSRRWRWPTCSTSWIRRMRVETRARARALQALYAWDLRSGEDLNRVAMRVWDDLAVSPEERQLADVIVRTVAREHADLDADLMAVTDNWRLERIGAIERSVLRLGAA